MDRIENEFHRDIDVRISSCGPREWSQHACQRAEERVEEVAENLVDNFDQARGLLTSAGLLCGLSDLNLGGLFTDNWNAWSTVVDHGDSYGY